MTRWVEPEPDSSGARSGCVLALAVCFLFWGAVLAVALLGGWL